MLRLKKITALFAAVLMAVQLPAAPARRNPVTKIQPDGTTVTLVLSGDEHFNCLTTLDGYPVAQAADGSYRYASDFDSHGIPVCSSMTAHDPQLRSTAEKAALRYLGSHSYQTSVPMYDRTRDDSDIPAPPGHYSTTGFPTQGKAKGVLLLVEFPDKKFMEDEAGAFSHYDRILNGACYSDSVTYHGKTVPGAIGSVRDYFEEQSYGAFSPRFDVIGPIMADSSYTWYGKNTGGVRGNDSGNAVKLVREACKKAYNQGLYKPEQYDADHDGQVDFIFMIYAGAGENYMDSDPNTIWPHSSSADMLLGNTVVSKYACSCELFYDSPDTYDGIGTICHEFLHILGLPDWYCTDPNSTSFALDSWSIMDYGMYDNNGFAPAGLTAFERYSLGWMDLEVLEKPGFYRLEDLDKTAHAYRISSGDANRFLVLENHCQSGWFRYQKASGLMVTAVSYSPSKWKNNKVNPSNSSKGYSILPADNDYRYDTETVFSMHGDLYPFEGNDSITPFSRPAAIAGGITITQPVYNVRISDGLACFDFINSSASALNEIRYDDSPLAGIEADAMLTVYSLTGQELRQCTRSGLDGLPHGLYIVKVGNKAHKIRL